jgi:4,4'-diaponeurosporenoate glycosyltransferase
MAAMPVDRRDALLAGAWAVGAWLLWRVSKVPDGDAIPPAPSPPPPGPAPSPSPPGPTVSVVIPARDEEVALPGLLADLAAQGRPPDEVIVVDDGSCDETAAVARRAGAKVLASEPLPAGWTGKAWACHQGSSAASGEVLVFLDADVRLAPAALGSVTAWLERGGGLVSVQPFHATERPYERLSAVANVVSLMGSGAFTGRPRRAPTVAFGPCLAISRVDYNWAGGHAHPSVRHRITEDIGLALRVTEIGRPVRVAAGRDLVSFRMYPDGWRQMVDGWTKMLPAGAAATPAPLAAAVGLWVTGALIAGEGALRPRSKALAWYGAWAAQMHWMMRRTGSFGLWTAAAFPAPLAAFVAFFARSLLAAATGKTIRWRGRPVPVRAREAPGAGGRGPA